MAEEVEKPPAYWTPDEAAPVAQWVKDNPGDKETAAKLQQYENAQKTRASFARPTEYLPPSRPSGILGFKMLTPVLMGGGAQSFDPEDPGLKAKFEEKYPVIPPGVDKKAAYKDFVDQQWMGLYDLARSEGRPVYRMGGLSEGMSKRTQEDTARAKEEVPLDPKAEVGKALETANGYVPGSPEALAALSSLPGKAMGAINKGLGYELAKPPGDASGYIDEARALVSPTEKVGYGLAGSLLPGSAIGRLTKALAPAVGTAEGAIPGMIQGAKAGVVAGGAAAGGQELGKALEDLAIGGERTSGLDALKRIAESAGAGGLIGGALGIPGGWSRGLRDKSDEASRALVSFENSGGTTDWKVKGGLRDPAGYSALKKGLGPDENPVDIAAGKAVDPLLRGAQADAQRTLAPIAAETEKAHAAYDAMGSKVNTEPLIKVIIRQLESRTFKEGDAAAGKDLPIFNNAELRKQLGRASDVAIDNDQQAQKLIESSGGVRVPLDRAIQMGIADMDLPVKVNVTASRGNGSSSKATVPEGKAPPMPDRRGAVRMTLGEALDQGLISPKANSIAFLSQDMDARAADSVISEADRAAGISENAGAGKADPMWADWVRATREMRDQLPPLPGITDKYPDVTITGPDGQPMTLTARSAMAHAHSQEIGALRVRLRRGGGFSDSVKPEDPMDQEKAMAAIRRLGPGIGNSALTRQARAFAGSQGKEAMDTATIANLRAGGLTPSTAIPSAMNPLRGAQQLYGEVRYNLDPAAAGLGRLGPRAAAIIAPKIADPLTRALMDLAAKVQHP